MTLGFMDTAAWIALAVASDPGHLAARRFYGGLKRSDRVVTTNYVVSETLTWVRYRVGHREALAIHSTIEAARKSAFLTLEWISPERHESGWGIFQQLHDQVLSFTDCVSAAVAREVRADYIFSFDRDFSILGFDVRPGP